MEEFGGWCIYLDVVGVGIKFVWLVVEFVVIVVKVFVSILVVVLLEVVYWIIFVDDVDWL